MVTSTISALTAILAGNLDDTAVLATDDKNANTRKVTVAQLRTQLIAPAITFPSAITVSGDLTVGASTFVVTAATGAVSQSGVFALDKGGGSFNVIGAAVGHTDAQLILLGSYMPTGMADIVAMAIETTLNPQATGNSYGLTIFPLINKFSSGIHDQFASLVVQPPRIGAGAATVSNITSLWVTGGDPTGGVANRALWVDAGLSQFGGPVTVNGAAAFTSTLEVDGTVLFSGVSGLALNFLGATTNYQYLQFWNTGGRMFLGLHGTTVGQIAAGAPAYATVFTTIAATDLALGTGQVTALLIDGSTQGITLSSSLAITGALQLGNAYVATPVTSSGYIIIKDSGGVDRKVMVGT